MYRKVRAYNRRMLDALNALLAPAAMERLTLLLNHVLSSEPVATERLRAHAGRCIGLHLEDWPSLLPPPPVLAFCITRAGLLEWSSAAPAEYDLHVTINAGNPALLALKWLSGSTPSMDIKGDAALASDVHWLAENLRWDIAADLERLFGPAVADQLSRLGRLFESSVARMLQSAGGLASRWRDPRPDRRP